MQKNIEISGAQAGQRLDHALVFLLSALGLPELGLRARRRLAEAGRALVDGEPRGPAYKVRAGQRLELLPEGEEAVPAPAPQLRISARQGGYAALCKPAGLHSAALAGWSGPSVEAALPELFPGERPELLNRLDLGTSGLLLVGFSPAAREHFRSLEAAAQVEKEYRAVALGEVAGCTLKNRLDTADRKRTRILAEPDPDPARWTHVAPLGAYARHGGDGGGHAATGAGVGAEEPLTLLRVEIKRGARHQIRAHLAGAGHPLLGDALYGGPAAERLYLQHVRIRFMTQAGLFEAEMEPDW